LGSRHVASQDANPSGCGPSGQLLALNRCLWIGFLAFGSETGLDNTEKEAPTLA